MTQLEPFGQQLEPCAQIEESAGGPHTRYREVNQDQHTIRELDEGVKSELPDAKIR